VELPKKRMAAGVLFRSADRRVLLVEPSYKPNWEIPGGIVEPDESPWAAAARVAGFRFVDGEILSAGLYTLEQARRLGKPLLADRLEAAVEAIREGVAVLCEHGKRVA
jgi:hypothetical protein